MQLCYFHYSDYIRNKLHSSLIIRLFEREVNAKLLAYAIKAICFVPLNYIVGVFENLKTEIIDKNYNELEDFISYFQENWINWEEEKDWNYHESSIFITNNPCESYNHHLNSIFHGKKPKFYYCLINLIKEFDEQKEIYFNKIKDVYSNISIFNNNYSYRFNIIRSFKDKEKNIVAKYENIIVIEGDEDIDYEHNKDIEITNLWTDFCKGFAKFIMKD